MSKGKRAAEAQHAIQEMSADLFYAKLRGEEKDPARSVFNTSEENLSREENLSTYFLGTDTIVQQLQDYSHADQRFVDVPKKTLENERTSEENLSSEGKISSEDISATYRPAKKISYDSAILSLAADLGMATFSMAILLRHLLPPEGGTIRVGALARSLGMSTNNVRLHFEALQNKGIIFSVNGSQNGRIVQFLHPLLKEEQNLDSFYAISKKDIKEYSNEKVLLREVNRYTFSLCLKEFAFVCFYLNVDPYVFRPSVLEKWIRISEKKSKEYALALMLESFSTPKNNPSAYLEKVLENLSEPAITTLERAKDLLNLLRRFNDKIGIDILPRDWSILAGKLGIKVKSLLVNDLVQQQEGLLEKLESFAAKFRSV